MTDGCLYSFITLYSLSTDIKQTTATKEDIN